MSQTWKAALARLGAKTVSWFVRHWRGELPLAETYWAGLVGSNLALAAVTHALGLLLAALGIDDLYVWYYALTWAMSALALAWLTAGVWRAAERLAALSPPFWARAAQGAVACQGAALVVAFGSWGLPSIRESREFSALLSGLAHEVRVLRGGTELELAGGVGRGLDKKAAKALDLHPGVRVVHVNLYKGGRVDVARRLGQLLRERKLTTYVSGACLSACAEAFLGGSRRYLRDGAKLGFHGPQAPGLSALGREFLFYGERSRLVSRGVDKAFASRALRVEPQDMWYPSAAELHAAGVIDGVTEGEEYAPPGPPVAAERGETEAALLKYPLYRALKSKEPGAFELIVDIMVLGLAAGDSPAETGLLTGRLIRDLYRVRLPFANDETLQKVSGLYAEQFRLLRKRSVESCWNAGAGGGAAQSVDFSGELPESFLLKEAEVMADVFESADMSRKPPADGQAARDLLARLQTNARFRVRINDRNLAGPDDPATDKERECEFKVLFYEELATVPAAEGAGGLRLLIEGLPVPAYR